GQSSHDASQMGLDRMKQPGWINKAAGALEYAEGGVPIVGPGLVKGGRQFETGDYAGGLGTTLGTAAAILLPGSAEDIAARLNETNVDRLRAASATHNSTIVEHAQRSQEQVNAADQSKQATADHQQAKTDLANKKEGVTQQHVDDAGTKASAAAANSRKATQAAKDALTARQEAAVDVNKLARKVQASQQKVDLKQTQAAAGAKEDYRNAIPPSKKNAPNFDKDWAIGRGYLEDQHNNVEEVKGVRGVFDAYDNIERNMEASVAPYREIYKNEPITTNVSMDVRDALAENPDTSFVQKGMDALKDYNLTDPTVEEADDIRKNLNAR